MEGDEGAEERSDTGTKNDDAYTWLSLIDLCSDTVREPWEKIYDYPVTQFFNVIIYRMAKEKKKEKLIK